MIATPPSAVRNCALLIALMVAVMPRGAVANCPLGFTLVDETAKKWICERRTFIPSLAKLAAEAAKATRRFANQLGGYQKSFAEAAKTTPVPTRRTYDEGVILGLLNTPYDAEKFGASAKSPFTGRAYKDDIRKGRAGVFAFGAIKDVREWLRGVLDNLTYGDHTMSTEMAKNVVAGLRGTHFKRLIAHSNGATMAEALIREGIITVDELNIVGGDRSLANMAGYDHLITSGRVKRVKVWLNPGDPIPMISSTAMSWPVRNVVKRLSDRVLGRREGGDTRPEFYVLSNPEAKGQKFGIRAHSLKSAYYPQMPHGYEKVGR